MMIGAGSGTASGLSVADSLLLIAGSVVFGLPGWLAYAGQWQRWTTDSYRPPARYLPFGTAWMASGGVLGGLATLIATIGHTAAIIAYIVLGIPAFAVFGCGLMFCFWIPRRLRPAWYRDSHSPRKGRS